jgi:hypothetical protein
MSVGAGPKSLPRSRLGYLNHSSSFDPGPVGTFHHYSSFNRDKALSTSPAAR